jgi:hypothetical protein
MLSWRAALALVSLVLLLGVALLEFSSQQSATFRARKRGVVASDVQGELSAIRAFARDVMPDWRHQAHYESNLIRRDVCNDTFPGRYSQTCSPSRTLCCEFCAHAILCGRSGRDVDVPMQASFQAKSSQHANRFWAMDFAVQSTLVSKREMP